MAHQTLKTSYSKLSDRLNRFPQGAPPSELLFQILKILFSEREAELVSSLPIRPFNAKKASRIRKMDANSTQNVLDELVSETTTECLFKSSNDMLVEAVKVTHPEGIYFWGYLF